MTPSQLLRKWRGNATRTQAAQALGVSKRTYEGWEDGKGVSASMLALLTIAMRHVKVASSSSVKNKLDAHLAKIATDTATEMTGGGQ